MVYGDSLPQRSQRTQGLCDLGGSQYLIAEAMCRILRSLDLFGTHSGATRRPFFSCCLWMILKNLVNEASGRRGGARRFVLGMPSAVRALACERPEPPDEGAQSEAFGPTPHHSSAHSPTHPAQFILLSTFHFFPPFIIFIFTRLSHPCYWVTGRLINYTYCFGNQIL